MGGGVSTITHGLVVHQCDTQTEPTTVFVPIFGRSVRTLHALGEVICLT